MAVTQPWFSILLFLVTLQSTKAQNYTIPSGTPGVTCEDGFSLSILEATDDTLNIELIDCSLFSYTHITNIGDNCYLYENKYTSNEIIGYIDAALNDSVDYVTLSVTGDYQGTNNVSVV